MAVDPRRQLEEALRQSDEAFEPHLVALAGAIESAAAAQPGAGQELQGDEDVASGTAAAAEDEYQQYLDDLQAAATAATDSSNAVEPPQSSAAVIDSITNIGAPELPAAPVVPSPALGGNDQASIQLALDLLAASVTAALATLTAEYQDALDVFAASVNDRLAKVKAATSSVDGELTNGSVATLKQSAQKLSEALQLQRDFAAPVIDTASIIQSAMADIQGLI